MKKILIIGGTGFLGKSMFDFYKNKFDFTLVGRKFEELSFKNFDIIIHAGASADPRHNKETFINSFEESIYTTKRVSEKLVSENKSAEYIYISSACVNFSKNDLINNSYLELKRVGELYTYDLLNKGIKAKIIRLFSVIGKEFDTKSSLAVNTFIRDASNGKNLVINKNANNIMRSYLYADEMSNQIIKSLESKDFIFEVGSYDAISIKEVAEIIAEHFKVKIEIVDAKFYSNTVEKQLPTKCFIPPILSSKDSIIKTLEILKNEK